MSEKITKDQAFELMEKFIRTAAGICRPSSQAVYIDQEGGAILRLLDGGIAELPSRSILQDWACGLGLRHQGVLLGAVRGPDGATKEDPAKAVVRAYRAVVLKAFCGDAKKSASFIEYVCDDELVGRFNDLLKSFDHYHVHWLLHFLFAAEVVGYKHPDTSVRQMWLGFYVRMCGKMHINPETQQQLDTRLTLDEAAFARAGQ